MLNGVTLKKGEHLVHIQRRPLTRHVPMILLAAILLIGPSFFLFAALPFGWMGLFPVVLVSGIGLILLLRIRASWAGTFCALTNKRIIAVESRGFVKRRVHAAKLSDVQDVAYRIHGIIGNVLRVGAVRVRFKGVAPNMRFEHMRRPQALHGLIRELVKLPKKSQAKAEAFERVKMEDIETDHEE